MASDLGLHCMSMSHINDASITIATVEITIATVENNFVCMILNLMNILQTDLQYVRDYVADVFF